MTFIPVLKRNFVLLSLGFVFVFSAFFSLNLIGQNTDASFNAYTPQYPYRGWYIIELVNIPIGVAVVSMENQKQGSQYDYAMQFASRIGISPITSEIFVHAKNAKNANKQITQRFLSKSQSVGNKQLSNQILIDNRENFLTTKSNFFFNESATNSFKDTLSPFPKQFLKLNDKFEAHYANDNFLKTAILKINENIEIEFKRVDEQKYREYSKKISTQKIDLDWLNRLANNQQEIETLKNNLSNCQIEMQNINKSILKQMPYESYLIYRRIINLDHFCSSLQKKLSASNESDVYDALNMISNSVKNLLKEDASELPHAISQFSEKTLYYNNEVSFLWPRITSVMIQNAITELANLYQLDLNRKSLLNIQVKISKMQPQAVVRADIRQLSSPIRFIIQSDTDEKKPYYLKAKTFIDRVDDGLSDICNDYSGNIGLDLENDTQGVISTTEIRGVWDIQTKLAIAREFSIQAALEKKCRNIYFRVASEQVKYFQQELDIFKNESLSLENSMLLSNFDHKKLWVIPGRYRITISSIINEKVISVQEFVVNEGTQTNVVANVN